jgi:iron complex outermembrane receptor protein
VFIDVAGTYPRYRTETTQYSFFIEDSFSLTKQWSLVAGARHDRNKLERRNLIDASVFDETFTNTSWRVGVVYQPIETLTLYGQYSTAVDPLGSLVTLSAALADFDLTTGNQIEVGVKQSLWDERFEWTLAAYKIVKRDLLSQDPTSSDPDRVQQIGQQSSRGLEASVSLSLAQRWRIHGNIAVLDARYDKFAREVDSEVVSLSGNTPPSVPERTANVWVTWAWARQWQAQAGLRYVSKRYSDNANELEIPSYTVVDAGVDWAPLPELSIGVSVRNAADELYATSAYTTSQWILGQPRTFELHARYQF